MNGYRKLSKYTLTIETPDGQTVTDTGKYVVIWKYQDDSWKLDVDIWNTNVPQPEPPVETEVNKAFMVSYFDALSGKDKPAEVVNEYVSDSDEELKQHIAMFEAAFPRYELIVDDMIAEGDKVAVRTTFHGTHQGEFVGIPPTGVEAIVTINLIYRIADGKIVEHWMEADQLGLMQQLGVIPPTREDYTWGEPSEVTGDPGDPETNKVIFQRALDEVWTKGNLAVVDEIVATDYVLHDPVLPEDLHGPEGYKQYAAMTLNPFPDIQFTIEDIIAERDKVTVCWTMSGTQQGEFMGIPPTGKQMTITGITIHRFADGKFVESWFSYDALGMIQQLTAPPVVDTEANKAIARRVFEEVFNQQNLDVVDEIFATDYVFHLAGMPDVHGPEGFKQFAAMLLAAFPELHETVEDIIAEGDMVASRVTINYGAHKGEFMGIPPTGNQATATMIVIHRITSGKIVEDWGNSDFLGFLQQLGVIPPDREDFTWGEPSEVTGEPGDPEANKAIHRRAFEEVWNQGNLDVVDEIFATDYVFHSPVNPDARNREDYKQFFTIQRTAFPDIHFTVEDQIAERDKVVARWTFTGTHEGELMGIPPTGKQVTGTGISILRIADGKIVDDWVSYDNLGMLQQIGAIPSMQPEDFSNVFFMPLAKGLNMISLPLESQTPYTARSFAEKLSATTVIKLDEARQKFVGFTLDAPDDGFAIEGGKGYIVNVPEGGMVAFVGAAWTRPPMPAPEVRDFGYPTQTDGAWAFVVSGRLQDDSDDTLKKDGYLVTVRNTRTNVVATDVVRSRYFAAAFADLNRKDVVQTGDRLELQLRNRAGEIVSDTLSYTVTSETIRQAFMPLTLKNVEIPRQNLLLPNYPNPFNPETWIPYQIRESADVTIRIYSANGQLVRTLDLGQRAAGFYLGRTRAAHWDGHNDAGEHVASGIYFYHLQAGDFSSTRRMLVLK